MLILYALAALCFTSTALAQVAGLGACPSVDTMPDFHISKIEGKWYEVKRFLATHEIGLKCIQSELKHANEYGTLVLNASAIHRISGHLGVIDGVTIRVADPAEPGKLIMKFPSSDVWSNYWILGTDYHSYLLGYNCVDLKFMHLKYLWISTRKQNPSEVTIGHALDIMDKQKLNKKLLITSDQNNCVIKPFGDQEKIVDDFNIFY